VSAHDRHRGCGCCSAPPPISISCKLRKLRAVELLAAGCRPIEKSLQICRAVRKRAGI